MSSNSVRGPLVLRGQGALGPYGRAIRRYPWVVAAVTLTVLVAAGAWLALRPGEHEATAQILVTPVAEDATSGLPILTESVDPARTLQTAANVLAAPRAAALAADRVGGGTTAADVNASVTVEPQGGSNIVGVSALAETAADAVAMADAYAHAALEARSATLRRQVDAQLTGIEARRAALGATPDPATAGALAAQASALEVIRDGQDPNFSLLQTADAQVESAGTSPVLIFALALMVGLALGTGAALALEQLDRHVRDEEDVQALSPLPVLARVPLDRRRIGHPEAPPGAGMLEAFRALQIQLDHRADGGHRVILVTSASEGDGKTTAAITLAETLVAVGKSVILLDLDLRKGDAGHRLGVEADVLRLLRPNARLSTALEPAPRSRRMQVLSAPPAADSDLVVQTLSRRLPEFIEQAREAADYVVIDTPPIGRVADALRMVPHADDVLLVVRPGRTNRRDLRVAHEAFEHLGVLPTGLVLVGGERAARDEGAYGTPPRTDPSFRQLPVAAPRAVNGRRPVAAARRGRAAS